MNALLESNVVSLTIQWAAVVLVAVLCFLLTGSIQRRFLSSWTVGWAFLSIALLALFVAFTIGGPTRILYTVYFLCEYIFADRLLAGCRQYADGRSPSFAQRIVVAPALITAFVLPWVSPSFSALLVPHCLLMAVFFGWSFLVLSRVRRSGNGQGLRVMQVALALLTILFFHYVPVLGYASLKNETLPFPYLKYNSLYDMILETLLAFGMVMVVMESLCRQLELANQELEAVGSRFRLLAEQDPLTHALNRHAFDALFKNPSAPMCAVARGSVVLADVDDFKSINDRLGHAAGDAALRSVAKGIRSIIRADDLLFRWGGDEFLIILGGFGEAEARIRCEKLNPAVTEACLTESDPRGVYHVSYGVAAFEKAGDLVASIDRADREMYRFKAKRKGERSPDRSSSRLASASLPRAAQFTESRTVTGK